LLEKRRNRRALSPHLALVEPIEQSRRCIDRDLRRDLDRSGGSAIGSATVDPGKYSVDDFCRRARVDLLTIEVFQRFLGFAGGVRDSAHHRRALHLRENAARDLGEGFFPSLAQSLRPLRPRCVWISTGISDSGIAPAVQRNPAWGVEFRATGRCHTRRQRCLEIIEGVVAEIVAPGKGVQWLGGQGDEWDAQNDMVSALVGSVLMVGVVASLRWTEAHAHFNSLTISPAGRDARAYASPARTGSEGTGVGRGEADEERSAKHFLLIAVAC
jgi:predicted membrane protein DUF2238